MTVLFASFKTIDYIVSKIPLVSNILAGTLITIPINVTRNLSDPMVNPLSIKAIGEGVLGIMKRTLELPFEVIQRVISRGEEERASARLIASFPLSLHSLLNMTCC